ncbi:hypothetical protein DSO57_1015848 [Entomophthora muscae]|uniref:Uncharacterized protein n=1 Tax=Entomophthora muscae TaxID=34485 RepID=A0ACC2UDX8_9FUNG|nr:hypothetical protein DSO57_1015848 [Entomophthora muscae]
MFVELTRRGDLASGCRRCMADRLGMFYIHPVITLVLSSLIGLEVASRFPKAGVGKVQAPALYRKWNHLVSNPSFSVGCVDDLVGLEPWSHPMLCLYFMVTPQRGLVCTLLRESLVCNRFGGEKCVWAQDAYAMGLTPIKTDAGSAGQSLAGFSTSGHPIWFPGYLKSDAEANSDYPTRKRGQ